jgi:hypothetical protein
VGFISADAKATVKLAAGEFDTDTIFDKDFAMKGFINATAIMVTS